MKKCGEVKLLLHAFLISEIDGHKLSHLCPSFLSSLKTPKFPIVDRLKGHKSRSELCGEDRNTFTLPEIATTFLEVPECSPECDFSRLQK